MNAAPWAWSLLLGAILIALFAYAVIRVRRARDEQRARSSERAAAMMLALHQHGAQSKPLPRTGAPATDATRAALASSAVRVPTPAGPVLLDRRPRVLTESQRLLYLLLRAALADHVIFANMRLVDLAALPSEQAIEGDERLRQLLRERLDCVVCSHDLVPLAALVVYDAGIQSVPDERIKVDALRELGIRFLRFRAGELPRPAEMRSLVLG
ncbi:MAG: hypothetical protein IT531_20685 [Burkholderiales bacterium]|nr:hypothetical protein [Burkholderiales bacterium]